jgi:hypothetical protein
MNQNKFQVFILGSFYSGKFNHLFFFIAGSVNFSDQDERRMDLDEKRIINQQ